MKLKQGWLARDVSHAGKRANQFRTAEHDERAEKALKEIAALFHRAAGYIDESLIARLKELVDEALGRNPER